MYQFGEWGEKAVGIFTTEDTESTEEGGKAG
jgi:hypothetical protein